MNARNLVLVFLACAGVALIAINGCTDRESPVESGFISDQTPFGGGQQFPALVLNPLGDSPIRSVNVAWASYAPPTDPQPRFPVLYLLHDFQGDGDYFNRYNLQAIVDDMYRKGEIGRMLVVTVGAKNSFGGSYYRNSPSSGRYGNLIGQAISYVEGNYRVYTEGGKNARGISGHGMGGYGAFMYALENPELFGSVSAMSAPLAFDEIWLDGMIDRVFEENNLTVGDSAAFAAIGPDPFKPYTTHMFGLSAALSPRDLNPFVEIGTCRICANPRQNPCQTFRDCSPCSVFASVPDGRTTYRFERATGNRPECSSPVIPPPLGVDLPFFWTKEIFDSVFNLWYGNDVRTRFLGDPAALAGTPLFIDCGVDDELGFLRQTRRFREALEQAGLAAGNDFVYEEYSGYSALPAGHDDLIGERLRKILKFHSDLFHRPPT